LVTGVDALGSLLEQPADEVIGRLENSRAHQDLDLGHCISLRVMGLKPGNQLLDFLSLGQEDHGGDLLYFDADRFWRVSAITNWAYRSVSC